MNTLRRFRPMRLWWSVPAGFALPAVLTPSVLCIPRAFLQSAKVPCLRFPLKHQTSCCRHDHHFSLSQALAYAVCPADGATTRIHGVRGKDHCQEDTPKIPKSPYPGWRLSTGTCLRQKRGGGDIYHQGSGLPARLRIGDTSSRQSTAVPLWRFRPGVLI